jgi:hypothetical protein
MTREEAIKTLKENLCGQCAYGSQCMESCDIRSCDNRDAIKALEQEPCADAVSREAMLDAITEIDDNINMDIYTNEVREIIRDLPPVTPKQKTGKWIPVSERLPEIKQHVLLSCYGRVIYGRMISEDGNSGYPVFEICVSVGDKRPVVLETTVHSKYTTSRIKAWMPLPEPYKVESEDT